ncbi:hypothetical protein MPSEU_000010300 [Mayamaea pseudoterrestris]|nr:hypothetical protein MPSEU_000010300 [Mayamaea pseudoterrestris]
MTTAHRPTWKAAVAKESGGWTAGGAVSTLRSVLDAPAHTKLKYRRETAAADGKEERIKESLRALEKAEREQDTLKLRQHKSLNSNRRSKEEEDELKERAQRKLLTHTDKIDLLAIKAKYNDSDVEDDDDDDKQSSDKAGTASHDNDDAAASDLDADDSDLDASSDSDDDDDDEAALQAELAKIRAERDATKSREEEQRMAEDLESQQEAALTGNPLLNMNASTSMSKKRSWTEESVFRHQAKNEPKPVKRFINDTVRNDFHKRFLNKFIR